MVKRTPLWIAVAAAVSLSACASEVGGPGIGPSNYALVKAKPRSVGNGSMTVTPTREWNRAYPQIFFDISAVEDWTLNGFQLDDISFVTGVKDGKYLIREDRREYRQVPRFRSNMAPQEVVAMIESLYRVQGGAVDFRTTAIVPRQFLGGPGFQYDYEHLDQDELWRRGRGVARIVNGRLYLIQLDATRSHYFGAALPDFEALVASARLRR